jgi:hypothetical protein
MDKDALDGLIISSSLSLTADYSIMDASSPRPFKNMLTLRSLISALAGAIDGFRADWTVWRI